jgi:hypothetical protein
VIAFKNDRVRHFITQKAPYITSSQHNALLHTPPLHVRDIDFDKLSNKNLPYDEYKVSVDAFAPFILEGSKPGAAAASLWLTNKCIPLNRKHHGTIIKNTLLSTRELYEWMKNWKDIVEKAGEKALYEFLPIPQAYPELNILIFTVRPIHSNQINAMNTLTSLIYEKYSIQAELGDKKYSYSQRFFLSKTTFDLSHYSYKTLSQFFKNNAIRNAREDYEKEGLMVLRATLMNPYIYPYKKMRGFNLIEEFMHDIHKVATELARKTMSRSAS